MKRSSPVIATSSESLAMGQEHFGILTDEDAVDSVVEPSRRRWDMDTAQQHLTITIMQILPLLPTLHMLMFVPFRLRFRE